MSVPRAPDTCPESSANCVPAITLIEASTGSRPPIRAAGKPPPRRVRRRFVTAMSEPLPVCSGSVELPRFVDIPPTVVSSASPAPLIVTGATRSRPNESIEMGPYRPSADARVTSVSLRIPRNRSPSSVAPATVSRAFDSARFDAAEDSHNLMRSKYGPDPTPDKSSAATRIPAPAVIWKLSATHGATCCARL